MNYKEIFMKIKFMRLFALLLSLVICIGLLASCDMIVLPGDGDDDKDKDDNNEEVKLDGIVLIKDSQAKFKLVNTSNMGSAARRAVENFIETLDMLGVEGAESVEDGKADLVTDCEIIVGTGARNRGDECNISVHDLGDEGYIIKAVGNKVVIAGGTQEMTLTAFNLFLKDYLGIDEDTKELKNLAVPEDINVLKETVYSVDSISIAGNPISRFKLITPTNDPVIKSTYIKSIQNKLYAISGNWLEIVTENNATDDMRKIIVRTTSDAGEDGFRVKVEDGNFIIECAYKNVFKTQLDKFLEEKIYNKKGNVSFPADYLYEVHVSTVKYSDYGAVGDGKSDDFEAIMLAHAFANNGGQKVIAESGKTYYIGSTSHGKEIQIATDVDWTGATFIIDDKILPAKSGSRGYSVFKVSSSSECGWYGLATDMISGKSLSIGDTNIGFTFDGPRMVRLTNANHQIYIRYGANVGMSNQQEVLLVDADGNIDPSTPIMWNYTGFTKIETARIDEMPITIKGGTFKTKANVLYNFTAEDIQNGWATGSQYYYYGRGISIRRSNTTVDGLTHLIEGEREAGGYPYNGFISAAGCYNVLVKNTVLTGHKTYTTTSNGTQMGSYDINIGDAISVTFKNCTQSNSITDRGYWGIMCSNFGRNLTYDGCTLSRFDAHQGVYNATVKNTTLGHSFSLIGGGTVLVENTKKVDANRDVTFITVRGDYGSLWRGDVIIKNCSMETTHASGVRNVYMISGDWNSSWTNWDFGYDLYMPQNITVENFTCTGANLYIIRWSGLSATALSCKYPLTPTKSVTVTNQTQKLNLSTSGSYLYTLKNSNLLTVNGSVN